VAKIRSQVFPPDTYPAGTRQFTFNVPTGVTGVRLGADCSQLTNVNQRITVRVELSFDNGGTWQDWVAFTRNGGPFVPNPSKDALTAVRFEIPSPELSSGQRRVRMTFTNIGASFNAIDGGFIETEAA
jgi:hypothetical protein